MKSKQIEPVKNPDKIVNYWRKEKFVVMCVAFSGIIYNVGMLAGPVFQGKLIDALILGKKLNNILILSGIFIMTIALVQALRYIKRYYIRRFANDTSAAMRLMLYNNVINQKERELEEENLGNLMTKAIADVDACVEGMRKFTTEVFDTGVLLAAYVVSMLVYDWKLTIIACIFTPVAFICAEKLKKMIYAYTSEYRKKNGVISGIAYDSVENALLYRIYGRESDNYNEYKSQLADFERKAVIANVWENTMQPVYNVIAMAGIVFVVVLGGRNVADGIWTVGIFSTYISIFTAMAFKASKAAKLFNSVQKAQVSWKRIKPYFREYQNMDSNSQGRDTGEEETEQKMTLKIENLRFKYPGSEQSIIDGITIQAESGEFIGVTGAVASGKSTFGKVFLGEYDYDGTIQINGRELRDYSDYDRCRTISYMGHNPHLISDTIYNNITLGDGGDITDILETVCFTQDMLKLESGIDTMVGNGGVRLSGGQQARIALARTLYHHRGIVILDDSFSAVDINTEHEIMRNIRLKCADSVVIIISHRLSVLNEMDKIILMNGGESDD